MIHFLKKKQWNGIHPNFTKILILEIVINSQAYVEVHWLKFWNLEKNSLSFARAWPNLPSGYKEISLGQKKIILNTSWKIFQKQLLYLGSSARK